ncbi:MAG: M24 family metallopeptidase, partial [Rhizobiaceae bacterium]
FFFDTMVAIGLTRYLPALVYIKGRPDQALYVGCDIEKHEEQNGRFWPENLSLGNVGTVDAMARVAAHLKSLGSGVRKVGTEAPFLPVDADRTLREGLGDSVAIADAVIPLERLRAVKSPQEIAYLRMASEHVVEAMQVTFAKHCVPGATKHDVTTAIIREEMSRGLEFDYNQITAGLSHNRAPSDQKLAAGDILSLDSGGNYKGYIGDLCRMGIIGEPDAEQEDLLGYIEEVQQAARQPIRAAARGGDIAGIAVPLVKEAVHASYTSFIVHGMGLVSHEAPRLMSEPRFSYADDDAEKPLEAGMCLSIETTMRHPKRGFIKLEDTVLVTDDGWEALGDGARGWNRAGTG